ncbi:MAG: hypothetical protein K5931_06465 [Lachnospiraceae bacterium]|nr:hypothetical protein [Lachnospiraceae bacterium]
MNKWFLLLGKNRGRIISLALCMTFLISLMPGRVYALVNEERMIKDQGSVEIVKSSDKEGEKTNDHDGVNTTEDESTKAEDAVDAISGGERVDENIEYEDITIASAEDLSKLSKDCRLDTWSVNKRVILSDDIFLFDSDFKPIPTFGGIFEGGGHTIKGLSITGEDSFVGLFCYIQPTGMVSDLNVLGVVNPSSKAIAVGGIAGDNYGLINNCTFSGAVYGKNYVGCIAGFNEAGGIILNCKSSGSVKGNNYTGGICGENAGGISACVNKAMVNTTMSDEEATEIDLDVTKYKERILATLNDTEESYKTESSRNNHFTDTGGIAGLNLGAITACNNEGDVGYEHVGYNTGGIAGRTSGYIYNSTNKGNINGRKDIGGIAGQAEPYVQLDLTDDIISQLTDNVNVLHDLIDTTLNDAGASSDTISMRLNVVKSFADKALEDTDYLANSTIDFIDSSMSAANDAFSRLQYVIEELNKNGGALDSAKSAVSNYKKAFNELKTAVQDADVYKYMSDEDKSNYDKAKYAAEDATNEFDGYVNEIKSNDAYYYLYLDQYRDDSDRSYHDKEKDLKLYHENEDGSIVILDWPGSSAYESKDASKYISIEKDGESYSVTGVAHFDESGNRISDFPASEGDYADADSDLNNDAKISRSVYAEEEADKKYKDNHSGKSYGQDMTEYVSTMTSITLKYTEDVSEQERKDLSRALNDAKSGTSDLEKSGDSIKDIANNLSGKGAVHFNMLGSDYQTRANSLNTNMRGISDNLGLLNGEMSGATDTMIADLASVNDQFNTIMLLFTDAMDGALEMDYTTIVEDSSEDVSESAIDGTVANCTNYGLIEGDIDTAGVLGTMAIDYDFDLESDSTGFKDASTNLSYVTKCIAREDINRGRVHSLKSYTGGITGLQEMGTVLRCESYGNVYADSGEYIGGIAGRSLSTIKNCKVKGVYEGKRFVGGISGLGNNIYNCYAIPRIENTGSYYGAIAGSIEETAAIKGNYFVSDDLCGIDRISYSGKAEPLSYTAMNEMEGVFDSFKKMTVTFVVDDEVVGSSELNYGDDINAINFPNDLAEKGHYIEWDVEDVGEVVSDIEIKAESSRFLSTLAGERVRENGQSIVLVDGSFVEGDALTETVEVPLSIPISGIKEAYKVTNPPDGAGIHTLRYQPMDPENDLEIYINKSGKWEKTQLRDFGKYKLFDYNGDVVEFAVKVIEKDMKLYYIAGGAAAFAMILILILLIVKKKGKNKAKKAG